MKKMTFKEFCTTCCDQMYDPRLPEESQCTGYKELKKMVAEGTEPASLEEIRRWETTPICEELFSPPDTRYLRFLHPNLRPFIIRHWPTIKQLEV